MRKGKLMQGLKSFLLIAAVAALWILLQRVILPRLGVST